ncbi:hypothetical protein [Lacimicrobium alkaliphilum]|uniref:hypothetical protein n=1 Tax=Lacimicrobium alkaliphilum TaxID=1526571 RepID=UPI000BFED89F|nr:hypothetical protein [Lacimicrobium alkaliphilum]
MGKTSFNKLERVSRKLNLSANDPVALTELIVNSILVADCCGINVNAISYKLIKDVLFALTAIQISSSNMSYYKQKSQYGDIVSDVAERLGIPVCDWVTCKITRAKSKLKIEPKPFGPIAAFQTLLEKPLGTEVIDAYYCIWATNGWNVGGRRNWIQPDLLQWLQHNNVSPSIPVSHCRPTALKKVYKRLADLAQLAHTERPIDQTLNSWIDKSVLDFCNSEIGSKVKSIAWLPVYPNLPQIQFVDAMEAEFRLSPYLYCRRLDDLSSKFGKAHNSVRFKNSDVGIVICMKRENDDVLTQCEYMILSELSDRGITPLEGAQERFAASHIHLCKIVLDICGSTSFLCSRIKSISATKKQCK